ncbi:MAG: AAA family ATPase [Muribaculaceae bacterium]|nr:AAA family ATPase [Muribaculaceae bacterium]
MAKKLRTKDIFDLNIKDHIQELCNWMAKGIYEKDHIIAMSLLCAIAGENIFLLGPPGTAKSMVASRLKSVFKAGKSFDYLMSRFSTPDEIFGPVSISKLKNEDKYLRLTDGYLPDADVVFLDEIWKAGPSIQNTLLTVINEHLFHNGGEVVKVPLKVLIAASNELPAKDEGLEALWDRFLVRMVSNCIESDSSFFKMLKSDNEKNESLPESLLLTEDLFSKWQTESKSVTMNESVITAIKALRKQMNNLEKEDNNQLRYYISDRRWRKAYRLMQTSAYLNGRKEINLTDYLLLTHCFWNDVETMPTILKAIVNSITSQIQKSLRKLDKTFKSLMVSQSGPTDGQSNVSSNKDSAFVVYDYFYYLIENYPEQNTYFSKWDYNSLDESVREGIKYFDSKRNYNIIHILVPGKPFEGRLPNASKMTKVHVRKCPGGVIIDSVPYSFKSKSNSETESNDKNISLFSKITLAQETFRKIVQDWDDIVLNNWRNCDNIFLSPQDLALVMEINKDIEESIKTTEVKINNILLMINRK